MMKIKNKLVTPISLMAAGLLAMSVMMAPVNKRLHAAEAGSGNNSSILHISSTDAQKGPKYVKIGLGKSMVLELPRPVRDVLVSNPKLMDAVVHTSNRVYLIGLKVGQANAFFFDRDGEQILTLEVSVEQDMEPVKRLLSRLIPGSNINLESINNNVILSGTVRTPAQSNRASDIVGRFIAKGGKEKEGAKRVVNMLSVESKEQVMLKVRIVEMNRSILKQIGVNTQSLLSSTTGVFSLVKSVTDATNLGTTVAGAIGASASTAVSSLTGTSTEILNSISSNTANTSTTSSITQNTTQSGLQMSNQLSNIIKMLEKNGLTRTLSEPNLTSISGETAKFHVGGEVPIPVASSNDTISVEWKKFGVMLNFTPVVLSEGRISLQIKSEVSEISTEGSINVGGLTLPSFATRNAESTIELPSGGSMMMAGLISSKTRQSVEGLPGVMHLPILGSLFRSRDYIKQEPELVVLVTPFIVNPVSDRKLLTPDVGFAEASDAKANLLGHFNRIYGRRGRMPHGRQQGDYGFIVE